MSNRCRLPFRPTAGGVVDPVQFGSVGKLALGVIDLIKTSLRPLLKNVEVTEMSLLRAIISSILGSTAAPHREQNQLTSVCSAAQDEYVYGTKPSCLP